MVQQDKDVLYETLQSNQETFTSFTDGGKDRQSIALVMEVRKIKRDKVRTVYERGLREEWLGEGRRVQHLSQTG